MIHHSAKIVFDTIKIFQIMLEFFAQKNEIITGNYRSDGEDHFGRVWRVSE